MEEQLYIRFIDLTKGGEFVTTDLSSCTQEEFLWWLKENPGPYYNIEVTNFDGVHIY